MDAGLHGLEYETAAWAEIEPGLIKSCIPLCRDCVVMSMDRHSGESRNPGALILKDLLDPGTGVTKEAKNEVVTQSHQRWETPRRPFLRGMRNGI
jgi:hypothetical protein